MTKTTSSDLFQVFVEHPTDRLFQQLRWKTIGDVGYESNSTRFAELSLLCAEGCYNTVQDVVADMLPQWQLSPCLHYYTGIAALELGDVELATYHRRCFEVCLQALLQTGDGSLENPYVVTYVRDEYDILQALEVDVRCQQLLETGSRRLDVITSHDGCDICFDVTAILQRRAGSKRAASKQPLATHFDNAIVRN